MSLVSLSFLSPLPLTSDQACLNAPEPSGNENGVDAADDVASPDDVPAMPPTAAGMPRPAPHGGYMTQEQQQQAMYYQQLQQQNQSGQYGNMPQMPQHQRA